MDAVSGRDKVAIYKALALGVEITAKISKGGLDIV
jgi:hypothetical protein